MGFWQNKNGQAIITGQAKTGTCPSATWLRQFAPFQDLSATATCSAVAAYDVTVFKAATCSGPASSPCNEMLKAQMLATAFDVYFSDLTLGGNKIGAPAPVGGVNIDLQNICQMIDGTGGTATCGNTYENVSSAFDNHTSRTVLQMLVTAGNHSTLAARRGTATSRRPRCSRRMPSTQSTTRWLSRSRSRASSRTGAVGEGPRRRGPSPVYTAGSRTSPRRRQRRR